MRTRTWLAGTAAMALLVTACGGDGDGDGATGGDETAEGAAADGSPQSLRVWIMEPGNDEVERIVRDAAEAFEGENDGVTVELEFVPWASAHDQFVTAIGGGQVPDVAEMGTTWTAEFAQLGLAPVETDADADYIDSLVEAGTVEGTSYGYPWYAGARGLIYRTDVFEDLGLEVPETWDELLEVGGTIEAETDLAPIHVAGNYNHMLLPMVWQAGGEIATEEGEGWDATLDSPEGREAFGFYADLWERGWTPEGGVSWNSVDVRTAFANEESAMMVGGGWDLSGILGDNPDLEGRVGTALLPEGPGGSRDTFAGGSHLVVFEEAENQQLAVEFIEFMLQDEQVSTFAEAVGFLPGTESGVAASEAAQDPLYEAFTTQLVEHSRSYPASPNWGTVEGDAIFVNAMQQVMTGDLTVDEAVEQADQQLDDTLNR
ncbi:sugar ABC transporter substrate-binding protein [Egicoccus halophilus]|uniref:Sugar ABC transporter substrate-binding protein n=1 Tax=Egicoccus halophilus TaxID=1670830 RepID=A0A8J3AH73_9ACTN|nr:sugar ABC transporter substrate-binding protein [Egicoccus halophilus]GGI08408.1 sugar ABC transporter substrate-binding protein [Egicoccus halophilus]